MDLRRVSLLLLRSFLHEDSRHPKEVQGELNLLSFSLHLSCISELIPASFPFLPSSQNRLLQANLPECTTRFPDRATHLIVDIFAEAHDLPDHSNLHQPVVSLDWFLDSFFAGVCLKEQDYYVNISTASEKEASEMEKEDEEEQEEGEQPGWDPEDNEE